jgi:hypothetical protein
LQGFPLRLPIDVPANPARQLILCLSEAIAECHRKSPGEPDLELRGKLPCSLGLFGEMLPGSFVERQRACGRPNWHCADGKRLHLQNQIALLVDGKPKTLNIPASWGEPETIS